MGEKPDWTADDTAGQGKENQSLENLHEAITNTAYFLWEQDGRPEGQADLYWQRAHEQHLRQRAYDIWLRNGAPEGRADDFWYRARAEK
ncbi:DUF2934 domain-containing protein [Devosia sp.]|uniref:DUF2934 domain-containing protein n=1 Tax=Devosia sp. TaxID=1871048 RepID=UPI0032631119